MNPNAVIESYVADVIRRVPLKERKDMGFELHALLTEMLDDRAQSEGKPADDAMVLAMLREFGLPADIAARYRAPGFVLLPPEQTRAFAWLSLSGIALQWALTLPRVAEGESIGTWWLTWGLGAFWWPGFISMMALCAAWVRQWRTTPPAWSPRDVDPDRVHRGALAFGLAWIVIGTAFMIALPWIAAQLPEPFTRMFAYDPDFLRTRAWLVVALWIGQIALLTAVLAKGRWTHAIRRLETIGKLAWLALIGWLIASGPIFVSQATTDGARFGLCIVFLLVLIDLGVGLYRTRPRLHAPKIATRH